MPLRRTPAFDKLRLNGESLGYARDGSRDGEPVEPLVESDKSNYESNHERLPQVI